MIGQGLFDVVRHQWPKNLIYQMIANERQLHESVKEFAKHVAFHLQEMYADTAFNTAQRGEVFDVLFDETNRTEIASAIAPLTQSRFASLVLEEAALNGYDRIVRRLLRLHVTVPRARAIQKAAFGGHADIVRVLLRDGRADPSASNNAALVGAIKRDHIDVVRELLADDRVDPTAGERVRSPLHLALNDGTTEVLLEVLRHPRALLNKQNNALMFRNVIELRRIDAVKAMLADARFDPNQSGLAFLIIAFEKNSPEAFQALLDDGRVDPNKPPALKAACSLPRRSAFVRMLLADKRVDPAVVANDRLLSAVKLSDAETVQLLLDDNRMSWTYILYGEATEMNKTNLIVVLRHAVQKTPDVADLVQTILYRITRLKLDTLKASDLDAKTLMVLLNIVKG